MRRGDTPPGPEAESIYRELVRGAALSIGGGEPERARQLLAACPEPLRAWEWHYLDAIWPEAEGLPGIRLTATGDGMGFAAESDTGVAPPPPEMLKTSVLLAAMGAAGRAPESPAAPKGISVSGLATPELTLSSDGAASVVLKGHADAIAAAAFTPDGRRAATASRDGTVRIWDVSDGTGLLVLPGLDEPRHIWFSPDGSLLFIAAEGEALIYVARPWSGVIAAQ
jgi:WD40 repeat protein